MDTLKQLIVSLFLVSSFWTGSAFAQIVGQGIPPIVSAPPGGGSSGSGLLPGNSCTNGGAILNAGTVTPNYAASNCYLFTTPNGGSITIANPTNLPTTGQVILAIVNGGGFTTFTWGTHYFSTDGTGAFVNPPSGFTNMGFLGASPLSSSTYWTTDGTNLYLDNQHPTVTAQKMTIGNGGLVMANTGTVTMAGDNTLSTMARMPLTFAYGGGTVVTATNFAVYKVVRALTIENFEGSYAIGASCSAPVIRIYDCGASAPTNANCSGGTQIATVTLTATVGATVDGTIQSANVAAGEYIGAQIQAAGSCTTFTGSVTAMARPQ